MDCDQPKSRELHIFFFPFMAHGHSIPMIDMAKIFGMRGLKTSIITTTLNAPLLPKTLEATKNLGVDIGILTIKFPCVEAGLPEGCESFDLSLSPENRKKFMNATAMLDQPLEDLLREHRPDCLISDGLFPWTTHVAAKFGIPRIVSQGIGFFASCAIECVRLHEPHKTVSSDSELFTIPHLPGQIKLTRDQIPDYVKNESWISNFQQNSKEAEQQSFGSIMNSFYELEPAYADYYRNVLGMKAWHIGPVSLQCNRSIQDKTLRGKQATVSEHECLEWLDSKRPNSVVYLCFGSVANFSSPQLLEIAMGLEASGQEFIWVVKKDKNDQEWLPEGFEERMEGKGLIIRGWAPQVLIVDHIAVGGFVTHCGWNSTLEGVSAGLPMVTWPVSSEQFYNEKLITEVLRIGVSVGAKKWVRLVGDYVNKEMVEKAVRKLMVGEDAEEMRFRAKELGKMARRAVEDGGSSYSDINALIEELRLHQVAHIEQGL